jgi:transposase
MGKDREDRRAYTPEQKAKIIKEALMTDLGVSGVCRKYGISSGLFYKWQERFFEGAVEGLRRPAKGPSSAEQRKIEQQAKEIDRMKSVIAEITAENIGFKKNFGDL